MSRVSPGSHLFVVMLLNVDPGHAHLEKPVVVSGRRLGPERPDLVVKNLPTEGAELGTVGDKISTNISSQESSLESRNSPCYVGHFGSEREDGPTESRNMGRHYAAVIGTSAFFLNLKSWWDSGPKLKLSLIPDGVI